ncbi:hypothetical protein HYPSUDRAFT_71793 [Hypholoma sublateritium FD-334 SS-4]|uniref:Uncharacterized protein n=1 Tax=Hypholoma sublateritium (strain FD-334 SS-4) TaxID=945553 RepID=A0A0D2P5Z7_HYPSF|nr:hypothetical protein HYPSUDRAFT_71793 [Hypholoma sublateritium FD-334 SS-4]
MGTPHEDDVSTSPSGTRASHSSVAQIADQPLQVSRANAKGKERAYDTDVSAERVDWGVDADGGAPSTPVCTSTPGRNISNDVDQQPSSSMICKPPRNISFFDSVKAHLARNDQAAGNLAIRNTNQTLANDQARKEQAQFVPTDDRKDHFTELPPVASHRRSTDSISLPARARNLERIALPAAPSSAGATPRPRARAPLDLENHEHECAASASANRTLHADRGPDPDLTPKIHGTRLNSRGAGPLDGQQLIRTLNNGADTHCSPATTAPVPAPAPPPPTNATARAAAPAAAPAVATYSGTARACAQSAGDALSTPDADDADADAPPAPTASMRSPAARGAHVSPSHARSPGGHTNAGTIAPRDQSGAHARAALRARLEHAREEARRGVAQRPQGAQGATQVRRGDDVPGGPAGAGVKRGRREDAVAIGEAGVGDAQRDAEAARAAEARLRLRVRLAAEKRRAADG